MTIEESIIEMEKIKQQALERERIIKTENRILLDAIALMSLEQFVKWKNERRNKS